MPLETWNLVARVVPAKMVVFCWSGTRTVETFTPTNCDVGTKQYREAASTTGPPKYPPEEKTKVAGTGAQPM